VVVVGGETVGIDACATFYGIRIQWEKSEANIPRREAKHSGRVTWCQLNEVRNAQ
jgi:hypothetical protein